MDAFDDLVTLGFAQVRREPIMDGGVQRGEKTFLRLIASMAKVKPHIMAGGAT
jgi:hypothetical protein